MSTDNTQFAKMMKKIGSMSKKIADVQASMQELEVEGSAAAGAVTCKINAAGLCLNLDITDESLLAPAKKAILCDLVMQALNNAKDNLTRQMTERMTNLGIPKEILEGGGSFDSLMGGSEDDE